MAKNRLLVAWDFLTGKSNKYNDAIYKFVGGQTANYNNTFETLLTKGYGENPDVNAIINQMASKTTAVPYYIKKIKDKTNYSKIKRLPNDLTFLQKKSLELLTKEAYEDEEQPFPLERPNPNQQWKDIIFLYKLYLKVCGNVYLYIQSPEEGARAGQPLQMYILPSHWVDIVLKPNSTSLDVENPIDYYILNQSNTLIKFYPESIIHIKRANPFYTQNGAQLYGYSELMAAIRNIASSNYAIDNNVKAMLNSGVYGFIHAGDGATPLTAEQAQSLKDRLVDMDNSAEKLSNIAGSSAKLGFTRIALTTDELKPFDFISYDKKTLCNSLNWPLELMNETETSGGMNSQKEIQARKRAVTDNIKPDLDLLAEALNTRFIQKFKGYENSVIEWDITELPEMQTDTAEMVKWMNEAPLTPNERRIALKYETVDEDGMDVVWQPNGLVRIDDVNLSQINAAP